jgi:hypothetical protein
MIQGDRMTVAFMDVFTQVRLRRNINRKCPHDSNIPTLCIDCQSVFPQFIH